MVEIVVLKSKLILCFYAHGSNILSPQLTSDLINEDFIGRM